MKKVKTSSRVPAYQNPRKVVGFCDFEFASPCVGGLGGSAPLLVRFLGASEKMNNTAFEQKAIYLRVLTRIFMNQNPYSYESDKMLRQVRACPPILPLRCHHLGSP